MASVADAVGNKINSFEWNAAGQLVGIEQREGQVIRKTLMDYDAFGRRWHILETDNLPKPEKNAPVNEKWLVWEGTELCAELGAKQVLAKRFFAQGVFVQGMTSGEGRYYYTFDHLGSIREMTDKNGTVVARYDYDPYGKRTKLEGGMEADFGFTGHYYHAASGMYLALFRAYDPEQGRWISRDPIGETGGINLYAYVGNDPVNLIDPLGLSWRSFFGGVGAGFATSAAIGFGIGVVTVVASPLVGAIVASVAVGAAAGLAVTTVGALLTARNPFTGEAMGVDEWDATAGGFLGGFVGGWAGFKAGSKPCTSTPQTKMMPQMVQQAQGKAIMTQWGWQNSPPWRAAASEVGLAAHNSTLMSVANKIPTQAEAIAMIEAHGGKVVRIEGPHPQGGVSTHTFPHINYRTAAGNRATVRIQAVGD